MTHRGMCFGVFGIAKVVLFTLESQRLRIDFLWLDRENADCSIILSLERTLIVVFRLYLFNGLYLPLMPGIGCMMRNSLGLPFNHIKTKSL